MIGRTIVCLFDEGVIGRGFCNDRKITKMNDSKSDYSYSDF